MRKIIFVLFLLATSAFVLTDPRWSGQLVQKASVAWGPPEPNFSLASGLRSMTKSPEARCAFARRWLSQNEGDRVLLNSELAAGKRVLESCQRPLTDQTNKMSGEINS